MTFNILKHAQLHSSKSNQHSIVSYMHSSITNTQINTYNLQMCIHTPTMLQTCTNAPPTWSIPKALTSPNTILDPILNQLAIKSLTCINGSITYWSTIKLQIRLHKQIYIHKRIRTMFGVRWSPPPLALLFIAFFLLGSYDAYGIS